MEDSTLQLPICVLELANRPFKALQRNGVDTVAKLLQKTEVQLLNMTGMGLRGVEQIKVKLNELGLSLRNN